tara:strand:+ start:997 stop:1428 length:432 start_codon:yes stop_codon:yes gene_type:complete
VKHAITKPNIAFWLLIPIVWMYGKWNVYGPFDTIHNSPSIMSQTEFSSQLILILSIVGLVYWLFGNKWTLTRLAHWFISIGSLLGLWFYGWIKNELSSTLDLFSHDTRFDHIEVSLIILIYISPLFLLIVFAKSKQTHFPADK